MIEQSKRSDYIKMKNSFNYNIFKVNKIELLSINKHKLNVTLRILQNDIEEFSLKKEKLQIFIDKIDKYIREYYDKLLQKHLKMIKTF